MVSDKVSGASSRSGRRRATYGSTPSAASTAAMNAARKAGTLSASMLSYVVRCLPHLSTGIGHCNGKPATFHHGQVNDVIANVGCLFSGQLVVAQDLLKCRQLV